MEKKLPIHEVLDDIERAIELSDEVILQAPPGAGKTTLVPLKFLGHRLFEQSKILMLEPRRIAARNAAARMADLIGEEIGQTIGYRMRHDTRVSKITKIEVITDGILLRMLQNDPALEGVGMIIFDEFHERGLDSDLGLSLALKANELFRNTPLKLLFMSATLDDDRLSDFLYDAPIVRSQGQAWPVEINYLGPAKPKERIGERVVQSLTTLMTKHPNESILVFLPGEGEIRFVETQLQRTQQSKGDSASITTHVNPLYGNLTLEQQRQAIARVPQGERKVVLATNIAETSLTIDGITLVLDSGLERQARFDPNTAMSRLSTHRISQASATQRTGRAGRTAPGICYRLWSEQQQTQLASHSTAEILVADLGSTALQIYSWGLDSVSDLRWLDAPPKGAWQQATEQLLSFCAIEQKGSATLLTPHGELMTQLPLEPRVAHMLIHAARIGEMELGCTLAALLTERDALSRHDKIGVNLIDRVDILMGHEACPGEYQSWRQRVRTLSAQFQRQLSKLAIEQDTAIESFEQSIAVLVSLAFPDRVARKRHAGGYQLANGRSASLPATDPLKQHKWLAIAEISGKKGTSDTIRTAVALDPKLFEQQLSSLKKEKRLVDWDKKTSRFIAEQHTLVGALVLKRSNIVNIPVQERTQAICDYIKDQGLRVFREHNDLQILQRRCALMQTLDTAEAFNIADNWLLGELEDWLGPYLQSITKLDDLAKLSIKNILLDRMSFDQRRKLDTQVPTHFRVPTGSNIAIDYGQPTPVLPVKLQEMFGCDETPTIAAGTICLKVHLLSPAGRPLQITQDLAGFWRTSYQDVRKDMRGRYPKHPWPEDPTVALPTRNTKARTS